MDSRPGGPRGEEIRGEGSDRVRDETGRHHVLGTHDYFLILAIIITIYGAVDALKWYQTYRVAQLNLSLIPGFASDPTQCI